MRAFMVLLVFITQAYSIQVLDSLVMKSQELESKGMRGFIYQQQQAPLLTPPEILFASKDTILQTTVQIPSSDYVRFREFVDKMDKVNQKITQIEMNHQKITMILDNFQKNSEKTANNMNTLVKLIEAITALIIALGIGGTVTARKISKKNGN